MNELAGKPCCAGKTRCPYFENNLVLMVETNPKHPDHQGFLKAINSYWEKVSDFTQAA